MADRRLFTKTERIVVGILAGWRCEICGTETKGEVDHIYPWSKGGRTIPENAQLLCSTCNKRKGARVMSAPFTPRKWQEKQLTQFTRRGLPELWMTHAGTGAGKTVATAMLVREAMKQIPDCLVVVCSPLTEVKRGWEDTLEKFGIPCDDALNDLNDAGKRGLSITYGGLGGVAIMAVRSSRRPLIVIFDEIHRLEEGDNEASGWAKWAQQLQECESVRHTICLTATPWREGYASLPFVKYDAHNEVVADFTWSYSDELGADSPGVVEAALEGYHASCDYKKGEIRGEHRTDSMGVYDPARNGIEFGMAGFVRARRRSELLARPVMLQMLRDAGRELEVKRKARGNIKGLVICESIETARTVDEYMRNDLQRTCTLITSKEKGASGMVDTFRKDGVEWCVSVGMLAEGVDVQRVKVVVDFSNILTLRDIIQRWGRALRMIIDSGSRVDSTASIYYIKHAMLDYVAERLRKQMRQAKKDKPEEAGNGGGSAEIIEEKVYSNHNGSRSSAILNGKDFQDRASDLAVWMVNVQYRGISDMVQALPLAELIVTGSDAGENPLPEGYTDGWETTEDAPTYSLRQQKADQRSEAQELVGGLARRWYPEADIGEAMTSVNRRVKTDLIKSGYEHGTGEYNRARLERLRRLMELEG